MKLKITNILIKFVYKNWKDLKMFVNKAQFYAVNEVKKAILRWRHICFNDP